jgi:hypothetical protein
MGESPLKRSFKMSSIHLQIARDGSRTKVHVDREAGTVHIESPDGKLRLAGHDVEAGLLLPLFQEGDMTPAAHIEPLKPSIRLQADKEGKITKLHVDPEKKTVHAELPNGSLRYCGDNIEAAMLLPEHKEFVPVEAEEVKLKAKKSKEDEAEDAKKIKAEDTDKLVATK